MKRLLFFFVALMPMLYINAQELKTKVTYQYENIAFLDNDGNIVDELDNGGIIMFADLGMQEYISITVGDEAVHTGIIYRKKQENVNSKTKMTVYLVFQMFNDHEIPLQIFEIYDLTKSSNIPDSFVVSICSATTGKIIQSQSFHGISRIR